MPNEEMADEMEFEALLNNLLEDYKNGKSWTTKVCYKRKR
jgi:hypothetical protein